MTSGGLTNSSPRAEAVLPSTAAQEGTKGRPSTMRAQEKGIRGADAEPHNLSVAPPESRNSGLEKLAQKRDRLQSTIATLEAERSYLVASVKLPMNPSIAECSTESNKTQQALASSQRVIKEHIALLHKYNEIKDIGLGLMGMVADSRGVRVASVMDEFGLTERD